MANVHYGLVTDVQCWSIELCAGLARVQPDTDWKAHMLLLKPIDHKLVAHFARHAFCNHLQCYTTPVDTDTNISRQCLQAVSVGSVCTMQAKCHWHVWPVAQWHSACFAEYLHWACTGQHLMPSRHSIVDLHAITRACCL